MQEIYTSHSTVPYFYLGFEFYLLGRIAFHKQLITSAAVMFHHAVERLLLAQVAVGKTRSELKQRYRDHKLDKHWEDYKSVMNISGKHKLDGVVKRLNSAVDLRFIDLSTKSIVFMPTRESIDTMATYKVGGKKEKPGFVIVLEDIDLFFKSMVDSLKINPQLIHQLVAMGDRMDDYLKNNRHIVFDPNEGVPRQVKIFEER
jgi:hypothetical protein